LATRMPLCRVIFAPFAINLASSSETPIHLASLAILVISVYSRCSRANLKFQVDYPESALRLRHYFSGASKFAATDAHPRPRARSIKKTHVVLFCAALTKNK